MHRPGSSAIPVPGIAVILCVVASESGPPPAKTKGPAGSPARTFCFDGFAPATNPAQSPPGTRQARFVRWTTPCASMLRAEAARGNFLLGCLEERHVHVESRSRLFRLIPGLGQHRLNGGDPLLHLGREQADSRRKHDRGRVFLRQPPPPGGQCGRYLVGQLHVFLQGLAECSAC